jgi:type VI secretion system protein ImpE
MNATDHFKAGKLQEAIDDQIVAVKNTPGDHSKRLFLFEMLAFAGELERARRQIEAINYGQLELDAAVLSYQKLIDAEQLRRRLFSDGLTPLFLADPPEHVQWRLDAINLLRENKPAEAASLLAKANEACENLKGTLNGKPLESLRDCDDLFAGVLEVFAQGKYFWAPLEQVDVVMMEAPKYPRDLLWIPARLELKDAAGEVFLPALYPNSHTHADPQIKLGRSTDWQAKEGGPTLGVGARMFLVGDEDMGLLEWREFKGAD